MREVASIGFITLIGASGTLVGLGVTDIADKSFEVIIVLGELSGKGFEQFRVRGWIADTNIVNRLNDPDSKEVLPDDICQVGSKVRVLL